MKPYLRKGGALLLALFFLASAMEPGVLAVDPTVTVETTTDPETGNTTTTTVTETQWDTTTTEQDGSTTTTTGSQTATESTVTDSRGNLVSESGSYHGSEETTNVATSTTSAKDRDVLLDESSTTGSSTSTETSTTTQEGQWSTPVTSEGTWTQGSVTGGQTTQTPSGTSQETTGVGLHAASTGNVTLNLRPNQSAEVKVDAETDDALFHLPEGLSGGSEAAPAQLTETDEDGAVTKVITAIYGGDGETIIGYKVTVYTVSETPVGNAVTAVTAETSNTVMTAPEGYEVGTVGPVDVFDENGKKIGTKTETVEAIYDEDSVTVIGYRITTVITTKSTTTQAAALPDENEAEESETTFTLPERPEGSVYTDPDTGETTTVTVEDVTNEDGALIGYRVATVVVDANGVEVNREGATMYGVETAVTKTTVTTPTSARTATSVETTVTEVRLVTGSTTTVETETTTQQAVEVVRTAEETTETWQLSASDGLYYLYTGTLSDVRALDGDGQEDSQSLQSILEQLAWDDDSMVYDYGAWGFAETDPDPNFDYSTHAFQLIDGIRCSAASIDAHTVFLYELQAQSGNRHYVLCVDMSVSANSAGGDGYNMENVEEAEYFSDPDDAAHIKTIALNGYWGTESGIGSLDSVKQLLRDHTALSENVIASLTPGLALAATQAALWYYGDSEHTNAITPGDLDLFCYWTTAMTDAQITVTNALCALLVGLNTTAAEATGSTVLSSSVFANNAAIVLKGNASDEDDDLYLADISFSLDMVPSEADDLVVRLTDSSGNILAVRRLAGTGTEAYAAAVQTEDGMVYTLEDVQIKPDETLTLTLSGTQTLEEGAYLYTADNYTLTQTFVGVAHGTRNINLAVDLSFSVTAPQAAVTHTTDSKTVTETGTRVDTKVDTTATDKTDITIELTRETATVTDATTQVYGDVAVTEETETTTRSGRDWDPAWSNEYLVPETGISLDIVPSLVVVALALLGLLLLVCRAVYKRRGR